MTDTHRDYRVVVLISGSGSNLQSLIDHNQSPSTTQPTSKLCINLVRVIANNPDAYGLQRASKAGIATSVINHRDFDQRLTFDQALMATIDSDQPDLVVLAGFMRQLTPTFTQHYEGRLINIHPSILPKYKGLHTHAKAIDNGDSHHGASIHFVNAELDSGAVVAQTQLPIRPQDTPETLAQRLLIREHQLLPTVVYWLACGILKYDQSLQMVTLCSHPLQQPLQLEKLPCNLRLDCWDD